MYVALPLLFLILGPARSPRMAAGLWVLCAVLAWGQPRFSDRLNVIGFAPCFLAGVLAYTLSGRYRARVPGLLWGPFLLVALCGFAVTQGFVAGGVYNRPLGWIFCLALGVAIPAFRDSSVLVANSVALQVARYSYGVYLFHCIALWVGCFVLADVAEPLQWSIALVLLIGMSVASYHWLEKPAIDFGARIARKWA